MNHSSTHITQMQVILDTNFLLIPQELGVDIFAAIHQALSGAYTLYVCAETIEELEDLKTSKRKKLVDRQAASIALQLLTAKKVQIIPTAHADTADEAILAYASQNKDVIVATQDQDLKRQLKALGRSVLILRQKKFVQLVAA
ncbi:MAG TPA: PIN domain-containing protein [Acidobacteriota bacterium]|nr:PIN domain-containing protein [Acidobacteriota bacterium]